MAMAAGIIGENGGSSRGRFAYHKKKKKAEVFFIRILPVVENYDYKAISKHDNLATIQVTNEATGKVSDLKISANCHGTSVCLACNASKKQHREIPRAERGADWYLYSKERRNSQVLLCYDLTPNGDGTFKYAAGSKPELLEYKSSWSGENPEWDDLSFLANKMAEKGIDIADADKGVVIKVTYSKAPSATRSGAFRDSYTHEVLEIGGQPVAMALPNTWKADVLAHDELSELHYNFSIEDLELVISTGEFIEGMRGHPNKETAARAIAEASQNLLANISNESLKKVAERLRTRKAPDGNAPKTANR